MKKRMFSNLALGFSFILTASLFSLLNCKETSVKASNQVKYGNVTSPKLKCEATGFLRTDEEITGMQLITKKDDRNMSIKLYDLPALQDDEVYFAVFIDSRRGIMGGKYCKANQTIYECSYEIPYHCDIVDIHIYKQKVTEPALSIKKENFIGRAKFLTAHESLFYRPDGAQEIKIYDENNNLITDFDAITYLSRLTPNYYALELSDSIKGYIDYAEIILPDDKKHLMTDAERKIQATQYLIEDVQLGANVVKNGRYYLDFYLPEGIDEFRIKYTTVDTEHVTKIYNFYIKLNKA